jgi:hypothetical protein
MTMEELRLALRQLRRQDSEEDGHNYRCVIYPANTETALALHREGLVDLEMQNAAGGWEPLPRNAAAWEKDAPDHWHADFSQQVRLAVWLHPGGRWVWELFDLRLDQDKPLWHGYAESFDAACRTAEERAQWHSK